jgi:hypothetical protein
MSRWSYDTHFHKYAVHINGISVHHSHHVQHLASGDRAEVLLVPSGDGFEAENSINYPQTGPPFHTINADASSKLKLV